MKFIKTFLPLLVGASILLTATTERLNTPYLFILGIVLTMFGLYNLSKGIRSKSDDAEEE